jgi:hypothetical protein
MSFSFALSEFFPTALHCVGVSSRRPSPFSLLRQRKGTKRKATPCTGPAAQGCSALLGQDGKGLKLALSTRLKQSPLLVRLVLRCSTVQKGPKGKSQSNTSRVSGVPSRRCAASRGNSPVATGEERRAGRDKKGRLFESRTRGEFEPLPRPDRAPQRTPRSGAVASGRLSLLTFFGEAKKVRRLSGRHPDAVQRSWNQPSAAAPTPLSGRNPDAVQRTKEKSNEQEVKKS